MDSVAPLRKKSRPDLLINNGNAPHHPRHMDHLLPLDRIPAALDNLPSVLLVVHMEKAATFLITCLEDYHHFHFRKQHQPWEPEL